MKQDVQPKPLLLVILLCSFYCHPQQPSTLTLAKQIIRTHCANREKRQDELFARIKKEKHLDREHYDIILDALELNTNIPFLKEHHATIDSACCSLHMLPGFLPTLLRLLKSLECSDYAKGPFYELETALSIQQHASATGERVLALNEHHANDSGFDREFDVVTSKRWIECKDCNWQIFHNEEQLLEQKYIVDDYNRCHSKKVAYCVFSRQPIPEDWQAWFNECGIQYHVSSYVEAQ